MKLKNLFKERKDSGKACDSLPGGQTHACPQQELASKSQAIKVQTILRKNLGANIKVMRFLYIIMQCKCFRAVNPISMFDIHCRVNDNRSY